MTAKEKAEDLLMKFSNPFAKSSAIILVNEMLDNAAMIWGGRNTETGLTARDEFRKYWYEVKNELEKYDT